LTSWHMGRLQMFKDTPFALSILEQLGEVTRQTSLRIQRLWLGKCSASAQSPYDVEDAS
jgi:hypothetical protein